MLPAMRTVHAVAVVACATAVLAGCSAKVNVNTDRTISKTSLEKGVSDQLTKAVGRSPDSVECPDPLTAKVGETTRCVLTGDGVRYGVTVTITAVDGSDYRYRAQVDNQPLPG